MEEFFNTSNGIWFEIKTNNIIKKNDIPKNVTHILFKKQYNQPLERNIFPKSITHIIFVKDSLFNQKLLKNVLPPKLTHFQLGENYDEEIDKEVLPNSILYLRLFKEPKNEIIKEILPEKLLCFSYYKKMPIDKINLPSTIKHLEINNEGGFIKRNYLPDNLTHFYFDNDFNKQIFYEMFPTTLIYIKFGNSFNKQIYKNSLPLTITHLIFGYNFDQLIDFSNYINIKYLDLGSSFSKPLNIQDLTNVITLKLSDEYTYPFNFYLLPNLLHFTCGNNFNNSMTENLLNQTGFSFLDKYDHYYNFKKTNYNYIKSFFLDKKLKDNKTIGIDPNIYNTINNNQKNYIEQFYNIFLYSIIVILFAIIYFNFF